VDWEKKKYREMKKGKGHPKTRTRKKEKYEGGCGIEGGEKTTKSQATSRGVCGAPK